MSHGEISKRGAFVKGGCGCVVGFLVFGILTVPLGAQMHINIGGVILLFIIGEILGLIYVAIYNQGRNSW
jgi:hypothetical protein